MRRLLLLALFPVGLQAAPPPASMEIDGILKKDWAAKGVKPAPLVSDEVFVRRIYLDVVGRIPSLEETEAFVNSKAPGKRGALIDQLLGSEGYTNNFYNFWADILRLQTETKTGRQTGDSLGLWLKDALRTNKRYDEMVRELITANGGVWDDRAVGFYLRDQGMPLDHLAATVQIFLGASIVCAQCHDHPFDKWTQLDYYHMAAYTYGVETNVKILDFRGKIPADMSPSEMRKAREEMRRLRDDDSLRSLRKAVGNATQDLRRSVIEVDDSQLPRLPNDYKYDNGQPSERVEPKTIFGKDAPPSGDKTLPETFAAWMTSPDNPRFTTVIANRLWKKAFGQGVVEPVDEMTDKSQPSNPELMAKLEGVMRQTGYNLKSYLRVIYNTQAYQRASNPEEIVAGVASVFNGPQLRRMTAEQIWDSLVTLSVPDVDARDMEAEGRIAAREQNMRALNDSLANLDPGKVSAIASELVAEVKSLKEESDGIRGKVVALQEAGKTEEAKALLREFYASRKRIEAAVLGKLAPDYEMTSYKSKKVWKDKRERRLQDYFKRRDEIMEKYGNDRAKAQKMIKQLKDRMRSQTSANSEMTRAAYLPSPAPSGHFLERFGQADRDTIQSATDVATVPQALDMLNGVALELLSGGSSSFARNMEGASDRLHRERVVFLSLLNREPTQEDRTLVSQVIAERGEERAWDDIVYAIANSRQFIFIP